MISVSIFSTQADRLFVPCEVMEARMLFLLVFSQPYSQPVMHDHARPTILEPVRWNAAEEVIDLPHQTHHHWCCLSANTCLSGLRASRTPLYTIYSSIYTHSRQNSPITQSIPCCLDINPHDLESATSYCSTFPHSKFWAVSGQYSANLILEIRSYAWIVVNAMHTTDSSV